MISTSQKIVRPLSLLGAGLIMWTQVLPTQAARFPIASSYDLQSSVNRSQSNLKKAAWFTIGGVLVYGYFAGGAFVAVTPPTPNPGHAQGPQAPGSPQFAQLSQTLAEKRAELKTTTDPTAINTLQTEITALQKQMA